MPARQAKELPLSELDATPLHEKVYQEIKEALMSGQFHPGQKLTSRSLAKVLRISDMPVRVALGRLNAQRALSILPNGTAIVPDMSRDRFAELMELRAHLEGQATEIAAAHLTKQQLRTVQRLCNELTSAAKDGDIVRYLVKNKEFKFAIYNLAANETLLFLIEILWLQVGPFLTRYADQFKDGLSGILEIDYHDEAAAALQKGDGVAARKAIEKDIRDGAAYLLEHGDFDDSLGS